MLIRKIAYILFCLVAGGAISAGFVAFITLLGVFDKLSEKLKAVKHSYVIETLIIIGVTIGNFAYLLQLKLPFGLIGYVFFELMGGVFIGCLAGALAETINIFPILSRRFSIRKNLHYALIAAALGKATGSLIQLLLLK